MAAAAKSAPHSSLQPACPVPRIGNPHRLVALWDIVNKFNVYGFTTLYGILESIVTAAESATNEQETDTAFIVNHLNEVVNLCGPYGFDVCREMAELAKDRLGRKPVESVRVIQSEVRNILELMGREAHIRQFLRIAEDRKGFTDNPQLLGERVSSGFPSAKRDIQDAGNCLAAECWSASVFHLMRVAEYGLRVLAKDRRVTVPKKPVLDLATWEDIIKQLEISEQAIQQCPATLAREKQFEFYHGAMMEYKRFKNMFRNRIMHTREDYDRDQANGAFVHVRDFMNILASRISEKKRTPVIWNRV